MIRLILLIFTFSTTWHTYYNSEFIFDGCRVGDTLYLATNGGILKTIPLDTLRILQRYTNIDGLGSPIVNAIESDENGNLWAVSDHHLYFKSAGSSRFFEYSRIPFSDSLTWIQVNDPDVFISTNLRLIRINTRGTPEIFDDDIIYQYPLNELGISQGPIERVRVYGDSIYIVTPYVFVKSMVSEFPDSIILIPADSLPGSPGTQREILDYVRSGSFGAFLTKNAVLFEDYQGNWHIIQWAHYGDQHAWFCCYNTISAADSGVFVGLGGLVLAGNQFLRKLPVVFIDSTGYAEVKTPDSILCDSRFVHISTIIPVDGKIIIGTVCNQSSSIYHNNRKSGGVTWLFDGSWRYQRLGLLENNFITGIKKTPDGKIWIYSSYYKIPTYSSRLFVFDNGKFYPVGDFHHGYTVDLVLDVEIDRSGKVWVATNGNGIFKFNENGELLDHLFPGESIKAIGFTGDNRLVFTTEDGTFVHTESGDVNLSPFSHVLAISTDNGGNIWIGDENDGFEVFDRNFNLLVSSSSFPAISRITVRNIAHLGSIHYIATTEGIVVFEGFSLKGRILPDVWVYSLDIDPAGYLWALSYNGVYVIDTRDNSVKSFYSSLNSGFPVDSMGRDRAFDYMTIRDDILVDPEHGSVWIGTPAGLSRLRINLYENYSGGRNLKVIPSPVRSGDVYVTVSGINGHENVFLYRIDGTKVNVSFQRGKGFVRFKADELSPGTYFLVAGDKKISFSVVK